VQIRTRRRGTIEYASRPANVRPPLPSVRQALRPDAARRPRAQLFPENQPIRQKNAGVGEPTPVFPRYFTSFVRMLDAPNRPEAS